LPIVRGGCRRTGDWPSGANRTNSAAQIGTGRESTSAATAPGRSAVLAEPQLPPPKPPPKPSRGLIIAGVVCLVLAFVIPLLTALAALVIGILLIPRRHVVAGVVIMVLAVVCGVVGLLVIEAVLLKPYRVPSVSMQPTLKVGDSILVNRLASSFSVGDIVVFHPPKGSEDNRCGVPPVPGRPCAEPTKSRSDANFIKRVVGLPGDTISIRDGHVVRNGKLQKETFVKPCTGEEECNLPRAIRVPKDDYFMMGDNRGSSDDSRFWGPVPKGWIVGKKFGPTY
jgi:signal peptidase I